ncbi:MAG: hypothetical protein U5N86_13100 [Planctomycetota bacterium]|nr:hypothetical protein [Planctomycetota bacterium]
MFAKRAFALILTAVLAIAICTMTQAEEEEVNYFLPSFDPGLNYVSDVRSEGAMNVDANVRWFNPDNFDWDFTMRAKYRHQTLYSGTEGGPAGAVQYYEAVDYGANRAMKPVEQTPDLNERKFFIKMGEPSYVAPSPPNKIGQGIMTCDYGDPFAKVLPKEPLKRGLMWEVSDEEMVSIFARIGALTPSAGGAGGWGGGADAGVPEPLAEAEGTGRSGRALMPGMETCTGRITSFSPTKFSGQIDFEGAYSPPKAMRVELLHSHDRHGGVRLRP